MDPLHNIPRPSELSGQLLRLSTMDCGSYSRLTSIPDIQEWTRAKADEYRQFALTLLTIHNLAAPIHRLPTEVLECIFTNCWHDRKSLRLSHVCGLWRSIILGRAAFWADAVTNCGPLSDKRPTMYNELPFVNTLLSCSARHSHSIKPFFVGFSPDIIKSLTPYISNVVSLQVILNNQSELYDGLWPVLCSGMPRLDAFHIELTERAVNGDWDEDFKGFRWDFDEDSWNPLTVMSCKDLPLLSRLTCTPSIIKLFGGVTLKHIEIVRGFDGPDYLGGQPAKTPREHLKPYHNCLETLEIVEVTWDVARPAGTEPLQLPSLCNLHIKLYRQEIICAILSWFALPQAARLHFSHHDSIQRAEFEELCSSTHATALRTVIATVDRMVIQCPSLRQWLRDNIVVCFTGDAERLHLEQYCITPEGLVKVFGTLNVPIMHLTLFRAAKDALDVDFRTFPHLIHLDMTGPEVDTMVRMLGPTDKPKGRTTQHLPALCPSLAELVLTCGLVVQPSAPAAAAAPKPKGQAASLRSGSRALAVPDTNVDKVFGKKCSVLQQVLARCASSGTHLTSLVLCILPATVSKQPVVGSGKLRGKGLRSPTRCGRVLLLDSLFLRVSKDW